jgi:hypothetical protein
LLSFPFGDVGCGLSDGCRRYRLRNALVGALHK